MRPNNPKLLIPIALLIVLVVLLTNFLTGGTNLMERRQGKHSAGYEALR